MTKKSFNKNLLLALSGFLLTACVTTQTGSLTQDHGIRDRVAQPPEYYLSQAEQLQGTAQAPFKLKAAIAYKERDSEAESYAVLRSFQPTELPLEERDAYYLLFGEVALSQGKPLEAIRSLQSVSNPQDHSIGWQAHYAIQLADSLAANNRLADAAVVRLEADDLFKNFRVASEQRELAWQELLLSPMGAIEIKRNRAADHSILGWLDMAIIYKRYARSASSMSAAMEEWSNIYPEHPAKSYIDMSQIGSIDFAVTKPTRVGLFVPMSGKLAPVGHLIRDGFMAGYYQQSNIAESAEIVVYDTQGIDMQTLYQKAFEDGVDFIVGPLLKSNIDDLTAQPNLPIPTLALNRLDSNYVPNNFFQFGLPVEDEARQIARHAIREGQTRAFVINADQAIGKRAVEAFTNEFEQMGGYVVKTANISHNQNVKAAVMSMLGADQAEKRAQDLQNLLNLPIEASGQGSATADFIFMVSKVDKARIIKPYLNYYYAYDLPVYATSAVYTGSTNPSRDNDLDGISFTDAPWMLGSTEEIQDSRRRMKQLVPNSTNSLARFFALGHDSFLIIPELVEFTQNPNHMVYGLTGSLTMDVYGRFIRQLSWGLFSGGEVSPLN
ncbi:penicillin-binding protein activator [Kangiella sediminilitoris]|uniref:LppC family lipoprotein n=1 Tax=Kangiella sediminilitoris TaxID=1144748 RepID=A0A1B3BCD9_9GAMM|nr:penicillin-binding protein activator [Kangiella sediminilitoris]AOE50480.1 LppC family lipoprotein [Kangiella sediminilitoris]